MARLDKPDKFAIYTTGDSLTEPEHKDDCDINLMIRNAQRGLNVRGGPEPVYGFDDTTMGPLEHRIQKQHLEEQLQEAARNHELSEEDLKHMPLAVQKKFGFQPKKKAQPQTPSQNDDDKTTTKKDGPEQTPPIKDQDAKS